MRIAVILGLLGALIAGGVLYFRSGRPAPPHARPKTLGLVGESYTHAAGPVAAAALGRLEPASGIRQIGALPGERLGELLVKVGDRVEAGAELAHLDSRPLRKAERDLAESQLADARARLEAEKTVAATAVAEARLGVEQAGLQQHDIRNQTLRVELAAANVAGVEKELARLEGLSTELVPQQERDQKSLLAQQARDELTVAKSQLDKIKAGSELGLRSAEARLKAAQANEKTIDLASGIGSLEQSVRLANARLDQSVIRAPLAGEILDVLTQPGEMIGQRPILQMADLTHMEVVAEVYETDIGRLRVGQQAVATSRALAKSLNGHVIAIGALVSQNEVQSLTASAPSAQRVVKVRIALDDSAAAAHLINLQVDVQFLGAGEAAPIATARQ